MTGPVGACGTVSARNIAPHSTPAAARRQDQAGRERFTQRF
jgi:hypothetical protein